MDHDKRSSRRQFERRGAAAAVALALTLVLGGQALALQPKIQNRTQSGLDSEGVSEVENPSDGARDQNETQSGLDSDGVSEVENPLDGAGDLPLDGETDLATTFGSDTTSNSGVQAHGGGVQTYEAMTLSRYFGPDTADDPNRRPYGYQYSGLWEITEPNPVAFQPGCLYVTGQYLGDSERSKYRSVGPVSKERLASSEGIAGMFNDSNLAGAWGAGEECEGVRSGMGWAARTATGGSAGVDWGYRSTELVDTMALDGGHGGRPGKSYFWYWAHTDDYPPVDLGVPGADPPTAYLQGGAGYWDGVLPRASQRYSVITFLNDPADNTANPDNNRPSEILFVPNNRTNNGFSSNGNGWSGGEVHQATGRIYFSGRELTTMGNMQYMIYDPTNGDYEVIQSPTPKTLDDKTINGWTVSSDMAIDGAGDIYSVVGYGTYNKWLVKVEPKDRGDLSQGWVYSKVVELKPDSGNTGGATVWGMAFFDGKLYFSSGSSGLLREADPLTGATRLIPGNTNGNIVDLASDGSLAIINGTVYHDKNRDGQWQQDGASQESDGESPLKDQLIQLYDADTNKVLGEQLTNDSGEYSFLLGFVKDKRYRVRLVQPQLEVGQGANPPKVNAVQTGVTRGSFLGFDDPEANQAQVYSFGTLVDDSTAPQVESGGYVDYPAQANAGKQDAETLAPTLMALYGEVTLSSDLDVTTFNFGVDAQGSWGDAGNDSVNYKTTAQYDGPRHMNPMNWVDGDASKSFPEVYLGEEPGWYEDGIITANGGAGASHKATDDGVSLRLAGADSSLENQFLAAGAKYQLAADVNGSKAEDATVRAWVQDPLGGAIPNPAFIKSGAENFANVDGEWVLNLDLPPVQTMVHPDQYRFIRVDATSSDLGSNPTFWNTTNENTQYYAPAVGSELSKTSNWVIDGEVEDYAVRVTEKPIIRFGVKCGAGQTCTTKDPENVTAVAGVAPATGPSGYTMSGPYTVTTENKAVKVSFEIPAGFNLSGIQFVGSDGEQKTLAEPLMKESLMNWDLNAAGNRGTVTISSDVWSTNQWDKGPKRDLTVLASFDAKPQVSGVKAVEPIANSSATQPEATAWKILATRMEDDSAVGDPVAIFGEGVSDPVDVDPGKYLITEEAVDPLSVAAMYVPESGFDCVVEDADGAPVSGLFDASTSVLDLSGSTFGYSVTCSVVNVASAVSVHWDSTMLDEWSLEAKSKEDNRTFDIALGENNSKAIVHPGNYEALALTVPSGASVVGLEQLKGDADCLEHAENPSDAPAACWELAPKGEFQVAAASHLVYRIAVVDEAEMPRLPITGGLGTYVFIVGAAALILAASSVRVIQGTRGRM